MQKEKKRKQQIAIIFGIWSTLISLHFKELWLLICHICLDVCHYVLCFSDAASAACGMGRLGDVCGNETFKAQDVWCSSETPQTHCYWVNFISAFSQTWVSLRKTCRPLFVSCDRWAWTVWQTALQQRRTEHLHEELALQRWTTSVMSTVSVSESRIFSQLV